MFKRIYDTWKKSTATPMLAFKISALSLLITAMVLVIFYQSQFGYTFSPNQSDWGTFGDYFGGTLNPILSFVAFIALILTFRQQLRDGERADRNHREILDNHRFFELLSLTHEAARGVEIDDPLEEDANKRKTFENHRAIGRSWNYLKANLPDISNGPHDYQTIYRTRIGKYKKWRKKMWPSVGSYFETVLFTIQRYVQMNDDEKQAEYCMRAIRNQMTVHERNILFYEMLNSQDCHNYMQKLNTWSFWRGGGDGMDAHRSELIKQATLHHQHNQRIGSK